MTTDRRKFLKGSAVVATSFAMPALMRASTASANPIFAPAPGAWRRYEVTTTIAIAKPAGRTQAWVPVPAFSGDDWMKPGRTTWTTPAGDVALVKDPKSGATMVQASWKADQSPSLVVVATFEGRDRRVDVTRPNGSRLSDADRRRYTAATAMQPTDGIVGETAAKITAGASGELDKAKRIYDWVVDNTFRNPKTRGCGTGDIASMLHTGNLSGKCADLNALYVGLARAAGLPARDIYGLRVAPSRFGYASLGAKNEIVTKAQHCRAEVFVDDVGWIPADPADVRKVVLEEPPGGLALDNAKVVAARNALFGSWETNWLAYNDAHDVLLPGSNNAVESFLMYPQGETEDGRPDSLDADAFKYTITVREVTV